MADVVLTASDGLLHLRIVFFVYSSSWCAYHIIQPQIWLVEHVILCRNEPPEMTKKHYIQYMDINCKNWAIPWIIVCYHPHYNIPFITLSDLSRTFNWKHLFLHYRSLMHSESYAYALHYQILKSKGHRLIFTRAKICYLHIPS